MSNRFLDALNSRQPETGAVDAEFRAQFDATLAEITKVAHANNIDLGAVSDDELAALVVQRMQEGVAAAEASPAGMQKHAGADLATQEQVAVADYLGRVQAAAMLDELEGMQKLAQINALTADDIDLLARQNANDILVGLNALDGTREDHIPIIAEVNGREKVATVLASYPVTPEVEEALAVRTMQHLAEGGWDVEKIAEVLQKLSAEQQG